MPISVQLDFSFDDDQIHGTRASDELERAVLSAKAELEDRDLSVREMYADQEDTLGPEWLPVLTAILSGPAILLSIRAIRDILKTQIEKERTLKVTMKHKGREVTITSKNVDSTSEQAIITALGL